MLSSLQIGGDIMNLKKTLRMIFLGSVLFLLNGCAVRYVSYGEWCPPRLVVPTYYHYPVYYCY